LEQGPENNITENSDPSKENINSSPAAEDIVPSEENFENERKHSVSNLVLLLPLLLSIYLFLGFTNVDVKKKVVLQNDTENLSDNKDDRSPKINFSALLAPEEFSKNLRDTVYTDQDIWVELRIDLQTLFVHYRDGRTVKYLVSTGNPYVSKSVESRPGLYAIFLKEEVHLSSQFNNARMNYYMPYNMGIGFHGLPGTGYYGHLGVRPSSHGCIRMRNEDVKVLFGQCKIGTLVLSHKGKSSRVVAFAPPGFKNEAEYTKDDYNNMLAYNMSSIMEGKYFINPPKRFIMDGTVISRSGVNVSSTDNIPEKQMLPFTVFSIKIAPDKLNYDAKNENVQELGSSSSAELFEFPGNDTISTASADLPVNPEMVKKYVYNPVGILPYFPPNR
jgi:hypothetical protein